MPPKLRRKLKKCWRFDLEKLENELELVVGNFPE
jgi:hypothetical protein